jgi:hypothetical protein
MATIVTTPTTTTAAPTPNRMFARWCPSLAFRW